MKTILVATDFSSPAENAVNYAAQLAQEMNVSLILFNAYKLSVHASNSQITTKHMNKLLEDNQIQLIKQTKELEEKYNINVSWTVEKDDTIESLKNFTKNHMIDLVVMGIESNLIEYRLFGNTTTAAIKLMQFPILIIPHDIQYKGIKQILYACESSYLKDNCELHVLKQFVKDLNAQIDILHVITNDPSKQKNEELEQKMDQIFHDLAHDYIYINNSKVGDGIADGLELQPSDLLVMIPHKIGFFESFLKGSNTNLMTVKTRVPLLVIPNEAAC